jgi:hypothetical protein
VDHQRRVFERRDREGVAGLIAERVDDVEGDRSAGIVG